VAREILIILVKFEMPDGNLVIGLNTQNVELHEKWRNMPILELKSMFMDKKIFIIGENSRFNETVLDVEIINSITDHKNVYLKLAMNNNTSKIKLQDKVEIDI
jgi:hypothetical protein